MFKHRSNKKEMLDDAIIPKKDLFQNLKELDIINSWLGGYNITFDALKKLIKEDKEYCIVDIGSGGGDTLKHIYKWAKSKNHLLKLVGIDLKDDCIEYSKLNQPNTNLKFICDDYKNIFNHETKVDIIHASLFCHHLSNDEIISLINFALQKKSTLLINDLERNPIAYYSIMMLTKLFSKSYLVKNDAPLSVLRGFKKQEWLALIMQTDAKNYSVKSKWAFRHEIIIYANN